MTSLLTVDTGPIDAAVLALLGTVGDAEWDIAPDGTNPPFLVVTVASDITTYYLGARSLDLQISYLVRAVGYDRSEATATLAAADAALQEAGPTVAGWQVVSFLRDGAGQRYADKDGFHNAAAYYKLILHKDG